MSTSHPESLAATGHDELRLVRKRNRIPLNCLPCRSRKMKCDRGHPCANCIRREGPRTDACTYAFPSPTTKSAARKKGGISIPDVSNFRPAPIPDDVQERIDRLEGLVYALIHGGAKHPGFPIPLKAADPLAVATALRTAGTTVLPSYHGNAPPWVCANADSLSSPRHDGEKANYHDSPVMSSAQVKDFGCSNNKVNEATRDENDDDDDEGSITSLSHFRVDRGRSMYTGQGDWLRVLADIAEVKSYFQQHRQDLARSYEEVKKSKPVTAQRGPIFLYGAPPASEDEIRRALPPLDHIWNLCARYFSSIDNAFTIVHVQTFARQLDQLRHDPTQTSTMWLGLLYSILCLAALNYNKVGDEPPWLRGQALDKAAEYRLRTVQCLILADYTRPVEYTLETMIHYLFGEKSSQWDADFGLWLISSLITRTAFRMGYHRDPHWFPCMSPFKAEMRRRTWALVRVADIIFSHQVSLPSMIYDHHCDTQLPSNLHEEDFGPDSTSLPPPRPMHDVALITYNIFRIRFCLQLGNILQAVNRVGKKASYDEIDRFDKDLQAVFRDIPPELRIQPLDHEPDISMVRLVIARFNLDILYHKIVCILHRKYVSRTHLHPRYAACRRRAIDSSMALLHHLQTLHRESQPGGRLAAIKWHVPTIAIRDFLLPAMLVTLQLHFDNSATNSTSSPGQSSHFATSQQRSEAISMLENARDIWKGFTTGSMDALKASKIVEIMLDKIRNPLSTSPPPPYSPRGIPCERHDLQSNRDETRAYRKIPTDVDTGFCYVTSGLDQTGRENGPCLKPESHVLNPLANPPPPTPPATAPQGPLSPLTLMTISNALLPDKLDMSAVPPRPPAINSNLPLAPNISPPTDLAADQSLGAASHNRSAELSAFPPHPPSLAYGPGTTSDLKLSSFLGVEPFGSPTSPPMPFATFDHIDWTNAPEGSVPLEWPTQLDWDSIAHYARNAQWNADQSFRCYATDLDQQQQQPPHLDTQQPP